MSVRTDCQLCGGEVSVEMHPFGLRAACDGCDRVIAFADESDDPEDALREYQARAEIEFERFRELNPRDQQREIDNERSY